MSYLLNLFYVAALVVLSPWLLWRAVRTGRYREGFAQKFLGLVPARQNNRPCLWLHAVSVGEVNLLATLLAEIARARPDWECVVSTTTRTGYELARKKYAHLSVFYCPLDFSWAVRAAMRRVRPSCLVLAELELWPNLIRAARESGASVAIVNGRLSEQSFRGYRRLRPFVSAILKKIDLIAVQDDAYAARFLTLGAGSSTVHVTGSMKYDGAETDRNNSKTVRLRALAGFAPDDIVFLAGSTQEPEEQLALAAFRELVAVYPRLRLVLVPRHPERFADVARMLTASGAPWQRRKDLDRQPAHPNSRVLLVDAVGELGAWWGTAQIAFVGGSMGTRGGQNMIEPAAYGAAVSFGPNTRNFRDIVAGMLAQEAAVVVHNGEELTAFVRNCLADAGFADALGSRARALVASQLGATRRTRALLEERVIAGGEQRSEIGGRKTGIPAPHARPSTAAQPHVAEL